MVSKAIAVLGIKDRRRGFSYQPKKKKAKDTYKKEPDDG